MPYIKSSHGSDTVLNQLLLHFYLLLHSKYAGQTLPNILIPIILKLINIWDFLKHLNGKNTLFGCKFMYNVLTLFLNLTVFLALVAKNIFLFFVLL